MINVSSSPTYEPEEDLLTNDLYRQTALYKALEFSKEPEPELKSTMNTFITFVEEKYSTTKTM